MEPAQTNNPPGFFERLKQHHIYRVVVVYAIACWVLMQLANSLFPDFGLPRHDVPILIVVLLLLFPIVLVVAWTLIKPRDPAKYTTWQRIHWKLGAALSVAVVTLVVISGFYAWHFAEQHAARLAAEQTTAQAKPAAPTFNPPPNTLVVLPFTNLSGNPKQQYFSDGVTEELTDALGQNPALRVIAWDTAAKYRNSTQSAAAIGKQLNVANLLHGSILRVGNEVRVTAELANTVTGYQRWSAQYDKSFKDIFAVQDQVSEAIADALQIKFAEADLPAGGTANPEAHDLVLKGRALEDKQDAASLDTARKDFEQAIALDPNYAEAHALLSHVTLTLTELSELSLKDNLPQIRAEAEKAVALDPRNADAWVALANADISSDPPRIGKARIEYRKALALDPSNASAHVDYGNVLPLKPGLAEEQEAAQLDPDNAIAQNNLASSYPDLGDWAQTATAAQAMIRLDPADVDGAFSLALAYQHLHQYDLMIAAFDLVSPTTTIDRQQVNTGRLVYQAVANPALRPQALAAIEKLKQYQSNQDVAGNLLGMYASLGEHQALLQMLEAFCPADPVGCNDLAINPMYVALHGDPRFERLAKKYTTFTLQ